MSQLYHEFKKLFSTCCVYGVFSMKDVSLSYVLWTIYSATTFLESCRKVVQEKWFEKSGLRNLVQEKWLTRKKGGFIL